MLAQLKNGLASFLSLIISLFFILFFHHKASYSFIPLLLVIAGFCVWITKRKTQTKTKSYTEMLFILCLVGYFVCFLTSMWLYQGKLRELDLPSRAILLLPLLSLCTLLPLRMRWILYGLLAGSLLAGLTALSRFFIFKTDYNDLFPGYMYIQAGGILMSLGLFSLTIAFYFSQRQEKSLAWFASTASLFATLAAVVNQARGAWVLAPLLVILIVWLHRQQVSKRLLVLFGLLALAGGILSGQMIQQRWNQAAQEISAYWQNNNGSTSVGARLDMWKSALMGIQEKPIFGHGIEGAKALRKSHYEQGLISEFASHFTHTHNQYLQDTLTRGLIGLFSLLSLFFVPILAFVKGLKQNAESRLWGILGITHVLATMGYCLTQAFLSHNSGTMFYFFCLLLFFGLQKSAQNRPLEGGNT